MKFIYISFFQIWFKCGYFAYSNVLIPRLFFSREDFLWLKSREDDDELIFALFVTRRDSRVGFVILISLFSSATFGRRQQAIQVHTLNFFFFFFCQRLLRTLKCELIEILYFFERFFVRNKVFYLYTYKFGGLAAGAPRRSRERSDRAFCR